MVGVEVGVTIIGITLMFYPISYEESCRRPKSM